MSLRGQRFELDLEADDFVLKPLKETDRDPPPLDGLSLVGDIKERTPSSVPTAPKPKPSTTGFPAPRPRSKFAQSRKKDGESADVRNPLVSEMGVKGESRQPIQQPSDQAIAHHLGEKHGYDFADQDKENIDRENQQRIADMSIEEIEQARAELMANLNPRFLEKLTQRNALKEPPTSTTESMTPSTSAPETRPSNPSASSPAQPAMHFPPPPPASSNTPYTPTFPTLPSPFQTTSPSSSSLPSWLQPLSPTENTYLPHTSQPISSLRFSFTGTLLPPATANALPTHLGLHHHGAAPTSAGYTIPELALLGRSSFAAQRCIAHQTLGRLLFRLGRGDFSIAPGPAPTPREKGGEQERERERERDAGIRTAMTDGLWDLVEREGVVENLMAEANRGAGGIVGQGKGHASARAYAVEGLWLWRRGQEGRLGRDRGVRRREGMEGMEDIREERENEVKENEKENGDEQGVRR